MEGNYFTPSVGEVGNTVVDESVPPVGEAPPRPVPLPVTVPADPNMFTHYVHLADGRVLRANLAGHPDTIGDRYYSEDANGNETSVPIIGVYAR